jgi:2-keto-4-pentenoate hydratase
MSAAASVIESAADALDKAARTCIAIPKLSETWPALTVDDAYAIQMRNVRRALDSGVIITGKKIGLTSLAMQKMIGVDTPDFGHLYNTMEVQGGKIGRTTMLLPKVEAEIAFVLSRDLDMDREIRTEDVIEATDYVVAALEIVDSRIANWKIGFVDTVSDNASSGMYLLGSVHKKLSEIDLKAETMDFHVNGERRNGGKGTDVLGDPAFCVAWLANSMRSYGTILKKGEVILSGALSAAIGAERGDRFKAVYSSLGSVEVEFI